MAEAPRGVVLVTGAGEARDAADSAAGSSDVAIRELRDVASLKEASAVLATVWSTSPEDAPVSADILRALSHAGNYVAGAYGGERLVGVSVGFLGFDRDRAPKLHSHISGTLPEAQGRSVGFALKLHQRAWALDRALPAISWTFDPLVRRNGWFNLAKLGADVVGFEANFYGEMADGINAGDESDRCVIEWVLDGSRARAASRREAPVADLDDLLDGGAHRLLRPDESGRPVVARGVASDIQTLLCWVPEDAVALRRADPGTANEWRLALRDTLGNAIAEGWAASAMTRTGWYVLTRG